MFSGWLQPMKSDATAGPKKRGASSRPAGSKKKLSFFVLRKDLLYCFKSDARADRAEYLIMLDYYRVSKLEWDQGWVMRLDLKKDYPIQTLQSPVYQFHASTEADIDLWVKSIAMVQREWTEVMRLYLFVLFN